MIHKDQCLMSREIGDILDEMIHSNMRKITYLQNWSGLHHTSLCLEYANALSRIGASRYAKAGEYCKPQCML